LGKSTLPTIQIVVLSLRAFILHCGWLISIIPSAILALILILFSGREYDLSKEFVSISPEVTIFSTIFFIFAFIFIYFYIIVKWHRKLILNESVAKVNLDILKCTFKYVIVCILIVIIASLISIPLHFTLFSIAPSMLGDSYYYLIELPFVRLENNVSGYESSSITFNYVANLVKFSIIGVPIGYENIGGIIVLLIVLLASVGATFSIISFMSVISLLSPIIS